MIVVKRVSNELKRGRRALDALDSVAIVNDWQWDSFTEKWYLKLIISVECEGGVYVPNHSGWYVVVDDLYPMGQIKIYPSKNDNFEITLFHQSNNGKVVDNGLWRTGNLCLDTSMSVFKIIGQEEEPNDANYRILWHVSRAIEWIICANSGKLVANSDPFELPDFNEKILKTVAFNEDVVSFMQWESVECTYGYVDLVSKKINPSIVAVSAFRNGINELVFPVKWGNFFSDPEGIGNELSMGIWILLNGIPTLKFWQAPNSFEELLDACGNYNFDLMSILEKLAYKLRDGKRHFLLVGFPIPKFFNGENELIHWKAIRLPVLSFGKNVMKGFRQNEKGYWFRDKLSIFTMDMKLDWVVSQNWNENEIRNRGRVNKSLRTMKIIIIGAGAIGAAVAELLTRAGVYNIHVQDFDILEIGNLTRHSLDLLSVNKSKSEELVEYLHRLNPNSIASASDTKFSFEANENKSIDKYDIIIDCTGEDNVLLDISRMEFKRAKVFASVSIGLAAKRVYILFQKSNAFRVNNFFERISPFLDLEREEYKDFDFPRDGVGCWSPLFPARQDDILVAASIFIKGLENFIDCDQGSEIIKVFNQYYNDEGYFLGYREAESAYE